MDMIERVARAIAATQDHQDPYSVYDNAPDNPCLGEPVSKEEYRAFALSAIQAVKLSEAIERNKYPKLVSVPIKPTPAMVAAGKTWSVLPDQTWQDMIDAVEDFPSRRRRDILQIELHNYDYGIPFCPDRLLSFVSEAGMEWFTDDQISQIRRKMIQQDWNFWRKNKMTLRHLAEMEEVENGKR